MKLDICSFCYLQRAVLKHKTMKKCCGNPENLTWWCLGPQVTNHVTRSGSGEVQPGLGVSWSHIPRTRILLERVEKAAAGSRPTLRSATLIKSSRQVQQAALSCRATGSVLLLSGGFCFCQNISLKRRLWSHVCPFKNWSSFIKMCFIWRQELRQKSFQCVLICHQD